MKPNNSHEFALFIDTQKITLHRDAQKIIVADHDTINRVATVLRLNVGEKITLFTQHDIFACSIAGIHKKQLEFVVLEAKIITPVTPEVRIILPLLEKEALEQVVYMAAVHGVHEIYLVTTQKSRKSFSEKDYARLQKISIAAAEQSKQFYLPKINPLVALETCLSKQLSAYNTAQKLWCDVDGEPVLNYIAKFKHMPAMIAHGECPRPSIQFACSESLRMSGCIEPCGICYKKNSSAGYIIAFGPEGDFTASEKKIMRTVFTPVKLTGHVLRACDAAALIMGIVRL